MWAIKERITGFLVIIMFMVILFSPARGHCVTLKGTLEKPDGVKMTNVIIFLYDWEALEKQGVAGLSAVPPPIVGITSENQVSPNFVIDLKDTVSSDKVYVLVFSTLRRAMTTTYPSFFYGAYNEADYSNSSAYQKQPRWWDLDKIPKIRFENNPLDLNTFTPPSSGSGEGVWLKGPIKGADGYLGDVGIELYIDQNDVPVSIPYPFYRFVRTADKEDKWGNNFEVGGILKGPTYYINIIANKQGYLDTFYLEDPTDPNSKPKGFKLSGNLFIDEYTLTDKGAKIWGIIKDKNNNPVTNSVISIQAISDNQDQPYALSYVLDPNYRRFDEPPYPLSDAEKHLNGVDRYYFDEVSKGKYEINGLPFEGHDYYLIAGELPGKDPRKFATPVMYDGNDGAFNINKANKISLSEAESVRADFHLNDGACIEGYIDLEQEISDGVKAVLEPFVEDPNIFNKDKVSLIIEAFQVGSDGTLSQLPLGQTASEGIGTYHLCGLPPSDVIIRSYGLNGFHPPEYYDSQPTYITAEMISLNFGSLESNKDIYLALGGMVEGRVLDSDDQPISTASVFVNQINAGNPLVGYFFINSEGNFLAQYPSQTDPNGRFYVWGLPEGLYTIFVNGVLEDENTGYFPQFYTPDNPNPTMIANQAPPIFITKNNPDFKALETFHLVESGEGAGGIISGNISLSSSVSSLVTLSSSAFFLRIFDANTGIEISNPLYQIDAPVVDDLPYSIMIPDDGDYILSVQDTGLELLPHYYRLGGTTVNLNEADSLKVSEANTLLKDKDFLLSKKSGEISGEVLDSSSKGISGLYVYASQRINEGPQKGTWKSVRQTETNSDGEFTLKGLYKGTYIFSVSDPYFVYAPKYYNTTGQDPYTPDNADTWKYDPDSSITPPYIVFNVQKGGKIAGSVSSEFAGTKVYAYRMKDGDPVAGFSDDADPNFIIPGLIPGEYILGFKDPNLNYLPMYYTQSDFTTDYDQVDPSDTNVRINASIEIHGMSFTQLAAKVEGQIRQETDTNLEPMLNTYIFLYRMSGQKEFWAATPVQFTATDPNGNYSLKGLSIGKYKIIAFGPQYRPISKFLTIEVSDLGSVRQEDLTFPLDWLNEKYDRTLNLEKGLNLIAYPTRIPPYVTGYTALSFLKDIVMVNGRGSMSLETISTFDQKWKSASFGNAEMEGIQITGVHGSNFYVSNGQGFLLYSQEGPTINFRYYPGQTSLYLKKGINLVGNVAFNPALADVNETDLVSDTDFATRKMLAQMGEDASISIQTFKAKAGKWKATYWMWGKPGGADTKVEDEQGYLVTMKEDLNNWYPTNNN
jgi:hypothetical protein